MNDSKNRQYDDIINLPHPVSAKHPQMSLLDRAAQFAPFAALTGHDAAIAEARRLTDERIELDADRIEMLDAQLQWIREHLSEKPEVTFTFFKPDAKKSGGSYETVVGTVKKIDEYTHEIVLMDGTCVPIEELMYIELLMGDLERAEECV